MNVRAHKRTASPLKARPSARHGRPWVLRLYVAGQSARCVTALKNLKVICEDQLKGKYRIEVIDLLKNPRLARDHQILAVPTLVRSLPLPVRNIIGDLSETERALVGLDLPGPDGTPVRPGEARQAAPSRR